MSYGFVKVLKDKSWTKLEKRWLENVKKILKQAASNSVSDVKLVRRIFEDDFSGKEHASFTTDRCTIYEVTLDNQPNRKFYVNFSQIMEIIGEEQWMKGEFICICNIASNRVAELTWGSKKKSRPRSQF